MEEGGSLYLYWICLSGVVHPPGTHLIRDQERDHKKGSMCDPAGSALLAVLQNGASTDLWDGIFKKAALEYTTM